MSTTGLVSYAFEDGIAELVMDDGKVNVMSEAMLSALGAALDRAKNDRAVVLLTGARKCFSGGYDLALFKRSPEEIGRTMRAGGELVARLAAFPFPVVAACNGHAIAQGAFLLLACDVRIGAAGPFKLGLNEVAIGVTIPYYGVELARLRLTAPAFNHAAVTGALYDPLQARQAGFLDDVVDPATLLATAREEARRLCALDMNAHAATKLRVRGPTVTKMREGIERELSAAASAPT